MNFILKISLRRCKIITLEMTENEAHMCLEAVLAERVRFRKVLEEHIDTVSYKALHNLYCLDYLIQTLKEKTGRL